METRKTSNWLARAFPVTRHADAIVELQNAYADKAQGDSRMAALGRYLVYIQGLVSVSYGEDLETQARTMVVLHRADQRAAAKDIAEWLDLPSSGLVERLVPAEDTWTPDIAVVVGQDFVIQDALSFPVRNLSMDPRRRR